MYLAASPRVRAGGPTLVGAALFLFCLLLGGGGVEGLAQSALVEALATFASLALMAWILLNGRRDSSRKTVLFIVSLLVLLALQLVPLPPQVWQALPGREVAFESLRLIGQENSWRPLTLDPGATERFILSFSVPIVVFLGLQRASADALRIMLAVLVGVALFSCAMGIVQIALDYPAILTWFDAPSPGAGSGIFANPNHHATFLSIAMIAAALLASLEQAQPAWRTTAIAAVGFLILGVVSTGARAGIVLLLLVLPACALLLWRNRGMVRPLVALCLIGLGLALVVAIYPETNSLALRESFSFSGDGRAQFLPDLLYVGKAFWPAGSGFGTFVQVFAANEDLDRLGAGFVNHAHNEVLEWLIEGGALGAIVAILLALAVLFAWRRRMRGPTPLIPSAGALMLVVLVAHSLFDYPLRTDTMAACAGLALALATIPFRNDAVAERSGVERSGSRRIVMVAVALIALVPAAWSFSLRLAQWADRSGRPQLGVRLDPNFAPALAHQSTLSQASDPQNAEVLATRAVDTSPMLQKTVSALAASRQGTLADATWAVSAKLGWRDLETQWWAMRQAALNNEDRVAAERADALLRSARTSPRFTAIVRSLLVKPSFRRELIERLRLDPPWRRSLFALPVTAGQSERAGALDLARDLRAKGMLQPDDLNGLIGFAVANKRYDEAWQIRSLSPSRGEQDEIVHDPRFQEEDKAYRASSPFAWNVRGSGSASGTVESGVLLADTDGEMSAPVARQVVKLPSGQFILLARLSDSPQSDEAFAISVKCLEPASTILTVPLRKGESGLIKVPLSLDGSCRFGSLSLDTMRGGRPDHVELNELSIRRAN